VEPAIREHRQTIRGDGGTGRIPHQPFQPHPVASLHRDIGVHTEARDHGAACALERIDAVRLNLISHVDDTIAGI
jgi:hypothetical protein